MTTLYANKFRDILHELIPEDYNDYTIIDWNLITKVLDEIKENLILMDSESMRINYVRTFLNDISYSSIEGWFTEISKVLEFYNNRIHYIAHDGSVPPKTNARLIAIVKFIKWRGELIFNLSELLANVYPGFMFGDLIKDTKISPNQIVWIERPVCGSKDRKYFISTSLIAKIYDFCVSERLFTDSYDISNFIDCFDLNKSSKVFPPFSKGKQKYFSYILLLIDEEMNGPKAKASFGIKSYPTEKNRWNDNSITINQEEFNFKSKLKRLLKVVHN